MDKVVDFLIFESAILGIIIVSLILFGMLCSFLGAIFKKKK